MFPVFAIFAQLPISMAMKLCKFSRCTASHLALLRINAFAHIGHHRDYCNFADDPVLNDLGHPCREIRRVTRRASHRNAYHSGR